MLRKINATMAEKRDIIMEIPISQSIERSMNLNILIHHLVIEGTNGGVMVGMIMMTSHR